MQKYDQLSACQEKRRRLAEEVRRLEAGAASPSSRLKLLLIKRDLEDLIRLMRKQQSETGEKTSRTTTAAKAVSAYARTAKNLKDAQR